MLLLCLLRVLSLLHHQGDFLAVFLADTSTDKDVYLNDLLVEERVAVFDKKNLDATGSLFDGKVFPENLWLKQRSAWRVGSLPSKIGLRISVASQEIVQACSKSSASQQTHKTRTTDAQCMSTATHLPNTIIQ